jgi:dTDP-4-dehydrorhamnose 3,5-epimerase-like enzyme
MLIENCLALDQCRIINFPKIADNRGNLSFIEGYNQIPFDTKRIYFLYDVPSGAARGGHAHKELQQIIIALSGSFDINLDDGITKKTISLNRPHYGLYIPPGVWSDLTNFSSNSLALSLASELYNESDYVRDYESFKRMARSGGYGKTEISNNR